MKRRRKRDGRGGDRKAAGKGMEDGGATDTERRATNRDGDKRCAWPIALRLKENERRRKTHTCVVWYLFVHIKGGVFSYYQVGNYKRVHFGTQFFFSFLKHTHPKKSARFFFF